VKVSNPQMTPTSEDFYVGLLLFCEIARPKI
jgi:hypothetical protein